MPVRLRTRRRYVGRIPGDRGQGGPDEDDRLVGEVRFRCGLGCCLARPPSHSRRAATGLGRSGMTQKATSTARPAHSGGS